MSNKASNQIHELIKSLSSAEKRYFKLYAERHPTREKKSYITLFEEIDKQTTYDEEALLSKLETSGLIKHFSIAKNRLYHQILKSLDAFHTQQSIEAELNQYLHYSQILFAKTLYNQCDRILNTALKLARKHQLWAAMLVIAKRKKRLAETENYQGEKGDTYEAIHQLEQEALQKLRAESKLWLLKSSMFERLFRKGQAREASHLEAILPLVEEARQIIAEADDSLEAHYLLNQIDSAYGFAAGDYQHTWSILKHTAEMLENQMDLAKYDAGMYISTLTNLVYVSAKLNRLDEANAYLYKARNLPSAILDRLDEDLAFRIFYNTYSLELAICNLTGDLRRADHLLEEIEQSISKWEDKLSPVRKAGFYHSMGTLYLISGNVKKALQWNNELLNSVSIEKTEDIYCFGQMLHLIIHVELGNYDLLGYGIKSLQRYLETRERRYKFESLFIDLLKAVHKNAGMSGVKSLFESFYTSLRALEKDPYEKHVLEYFDFGAWAESQFTGEAISAILQRKAPDKDIL